MSPAPTTTSNPRRAADRGRHGYIARECVRGSAALHGVPTGSSSSMMSARHCTAFVPNVGRSFGKPRDVHVDAPTLACDLSAASTGRSLEQASSCSSSPFASTFSATASLPASRASGLSAKLRIVCQNQRRASAADRSSAGTMGIRRPSRYLRPKRTSWERAKLSAVRIIASGKTTSASQRRTAVREPRSETSSMSRRRAATFSNRWGMRRGAFRTSSLAITQRSVSEVSAPVSAASAFVYGLSENARRSACAPATGTGARSIRTGTGARLTATRASTARCSSAKWRWISSVTARSALGSCARSRSSSSPASAIVRSHRRPGDARDASETRLDRRRNVARDPVVARTMPRRAPRRHLTGRGVTTGRRVGQRAPNALRRPHVPARVDQRPPVRDDRGRRRVLRRRRRRGRGVLERARQCRLPRAHEGRRVGDSPSRAAASSSNVVTRPNPRGTVLPDASEVRPAALIGHIVPPPPRLAPAGV